MYYLRVALLVLFISGALAHFDCHAHDVTEELLTRNPSMRESFEKFHERIYHLANNGSLHARSVTSYRIPVVVHIFEPLSSVSTYPPIPDSAIHAEINLLNRWFSGSNENYVNGAQLWESRIAPGDSFGMSFELAGYDPNGNPTSGIVRRATALATNGECRQNFFKPENGGINLWNTLQYFNIILCRLTDNIAGFAYLPGAITGPYDGAVIDPAFFGVGDSKGLVTAHETGHFFGLYHTFENCNPGDYVDDTPAHSITTGDAPVSGGYCPPTTPETSFISDCPSVGNYMTQNVMNYNIFQCYSFFSKGQVARMRAVIEGDTVRSGLPYSTGLSSEDGCIRRCANKLCGDDGCGGVCGMCFGAKTCVNGQCINQIEVCSNALAVAFSYSQPAERSSSIELDNNDILTAPGTCNQIVPYSNVRWFKFTASHSNNITISTTSNLDTKLAVYTGSCSDLICVASNDDISFSEYDSRVSFCATQGTTYFVTAAGYDNLVFGPFTISFRYTPSVTCCTPVCQGRNCGDDSCGGLCGQCEFYQRCSSDFRCFGERPTPSPSLLAPIIICPHDLAKTVTGCSYNGSIGIPQVIVPNGASYTTSKSPKGPYGVGSHQITHSATANGFTQSCKQSLVVSTSASNCATQ